MVNPVVECRSCGARNRVPVVTGGKVRCASCKADLPWLVNADDSNFDDLVASSTVPIVVDLWAEWCGPCRMVAPALEQLATERAGDIRVVKVNVDLARQTAMKMGSQSIPTLILIDDGNEVARQVGAMPIAGIRNWLDGALTS
ncbi:MAG: thioredoxin [Actinomycetia bacterium]|nr:thioredoxin [Actinomycetes bacterium]MCP4958530.1 thioredoxin [Actinomycetes bacterium]